MDQQSEHAFVTKKLRKARARQRRVLAGIEDWLVEQAMKGLPTDPPLPQSESMRVFIEERLRERVDAQLKEHAELLDEMADAYVARNLAWFLAGCKDSANGVFPSAELLDQSYAKRPVQQVDTAQGHFIWEAVALLVWADTLAGDYRDPRLPIAA